MADDLNAGAQAPAMEQAAQVSTPAPESVENSAPTPVDNDAELREIWERHEKGVTAREQTRDEHGRFTRPEAEKAEAVAPNEPGDKAIPEGQESPDTSEVQPEPQQTVPAIEPPVSWSREAREHWSKIPAEAQQVIAQREREAHAQISQLGQQFKAVEPVANVLKQNADVFQRRGVPFDQGVAALISAQRELDRDPYSAIQFIAQTAGIDLSVFANGNGSSQSPEVASLQHQLAQAMQEVTQLKQRVLTREEQEQTALLHQAEQEIQSFQSEKQIDEATMDAMVDRVAWYSQNNPNLTVRQKLEKAYEDVVWTDPQRRQAMIEKELTAKRAEAEKAAREKSEKARKAGSVNVRSTPVNSARAVDNDAELKAIWERARAS